MDSTTHTTTTVEFVDWRAKAKEKLEAEDKMFKGGRAAASVQSYVLRALLNFADQEPRFAEVVCNTERTFSECCAAVVHNAGEVLSDLEAYRKAVQFYFPNAEISFSMNINLTGTPPTEEEMRAPATIKPENATPNIPKPQEPAKEKPDQKKPKPEKKPAKKKEKQSERNSPTGSYEKQAGWVENGTRCIQCLREKPDSKKSRWFFCRKLQGSDTCCMVERNDVDRAFSGK